MHPYTSPRAAPFLLYAEQNATLGLAGTLSDGSTPLFAAALRRIGMASESEVVIDARSAQYICQPAVGALIARVRELNVTAVLRVSGPHSASLTSSYPGLTIERALSSRWLGRTESIKRLQRGQHVGAIPCLNFHRYWGNIRLAANRPEVTSRGW
jgi:hypothetical protein